MNVKYENLSKIYYKKDVKDYEKVYQERFHSPSTLQLPLTLKTDHNNEYPLFVMTLPKHLEQIEYITESIHQWDFFDTHTYHNIFKENYIQKLLKDEIKLSNEIEGEATQKEELEDVLQNMGDSTKRFHYIVTKYEKLLHQEENKLSTPEDIRKIYDELLMDGIDEADLPDGTLFRKGTVSIYHRSGNGREVHRGLFPEEVIYQKIASLLHFFNTVPIPFYIKLAVVHYYIGYIHPFYDGNGRLTRYISSQLLALEKNHFLALKISKVIKDSIKEYDKMFEATASEYNRGDFTPFLTYFMNVLVSACIEITNEIEYYQLQNRNMRIFIDEQLDIKSEIEKQVLLVVYQAEMLKNPIEAKNVAQLIGRSPQMTRKHLNNCIRKNYIERGGIHNNKFFYITNNLNEHMIEYFMHE